MENLIVNKDGSPVNGGKLTEEYIRKLKIPIENRWKSARNYVTPRSNLRILIGVTGGAGVLTSVFLTCIEAPIRVQVITYTLSLTVNIANDTLHMFSRVMSVPVRVMWCGVLMMFVLTLIYSTNGLKLATVIAAILVTILTFFMNDFWLKQENYLMSDEVHHALHGDKDNRAEKTWSADGKRHTRTVLYELGVSISDADLDTIMKAIYSVGYWDSAKVLNQEICDLERQIRKFEKSDPNEKHSKEYKELLADFESARQSRDYFQYHAQRNLAKVYELMGIEYDGLSYVFEDLKEDDKDYIVLEQKEEPIEIEIDQNEQSAVPGLTCEQYDEIRSLLEQGEAKKSIERITGVSRYYITKVKEKEECK